MLNISIRVNELTSVQGFKRKGAKFLSSLSAGESQGEVVAGADVFVYFPCNL